VGGGGGQGVGARESRGRESGEGAGVLRGRELGEKCKMLIFVIKYFQKQDPKCYLTNI